VFDKLSLTAQTYSAFYPPIGDFSSETITNNENARDTTTELALGRKK
jgi:hypothetical protein